MCVGESNDWEGTPGDNNLSLSFTREMGVTTEDSVVTASGDPVLVRNSRVVEVSVGEHLDKFESDCFLVGVSKTVAEDGGKEFGVWVLVAFVDLDTEQPIGSVVRRRRLKLYSGDEKSLSESHDTIER